MKVIDLNEAKTNLEQCARECQISPVVVTVDGKPAFEMLPVRAEDGDFLGSEFRPLGRLDFFRARPHR